MRLPHIVLFILICFLITIIVLWNTPMPEGITGMKHPEYGTMAKSGATMQGNTTVQVLSYIFGLCMIGIFGTSLLFGAKRKGKWADARKLILVGIVAYLFTYTMMFVSYLGYLEGSNSYFLSFPTPTAWMLYGMSAAPLIFVIGYVLKFEKWVLTNEDFEHFKELIK